MRDILVLLIVLVGIPKILMNPHIGVYFWSWISYMNPHRLSWGFSYSFPYAMLVAVLTVISFVTSKETKKFPVTPVTVTLIIFIIWMSITTFFALYPEDAKIEYIRVIKIQFFTILTLILINNRERIQTLVWVIALSVGFFGIKGGVFSILSGLNFRVWGPPGSYFEGNNELGLALLMVLPMFRFMQMTVDNKWIKRALLGAMVLIGVSIITTYSRGAFLGAMAMMFFFWLKSPNKLPIGLAAVLAIVVTLMAMPDKYFERMSTIQTYDQDESALGRISAWTMAYNLAKDRVTAGGYGPWKEEVFAVYSDPTRVFDAHSIYFEVLGEQGFIGLFIFLFLFFLAWRTGSWIIKNSKGREDLVWALNLARMLQVGLVAYATGGAFLGLAYFDLPYHMVALLVLTRVCVEQALAEPKTVKDEVVKPSESTGSTKVKWRWEQ